MHLCAARWMQQGETVWKSLHFHVHQSLAQFSMKQKESSADTADTDMDAMASMVSMVNMVSIALMGTMQKPEKKVQNMWM